MLVKRASATVIGIVEPCDVGHFYKVANIQRIEDIDPDYCYIRTRAIGNLEIDGDNGNNDGFPYSQFVDTRPCYGYKSFEGKDAFVEHQSDNIRNSIGTLSAAYLNAFIIPEKYSSWYDIPDRERIDVLTLPNQKDGSIEVLMKIDKSRAPTIARKVEKEEPLHVSMGTNVDYSICSVCGNNAHYERQFCDDVKWNKGGTKLVPAEQIRGLVKNGVIESPWLKWILPRESDRSEVLNKSASNRMVLARVFEINYGLQFFELSVVTNPAFTRGHLLERIAKKIGWGSFTNDQMLLVQRLIEELSVNN